MVIVIDQISKIIVKTSMTIGEQFSVIGDWAKILFIENNGMAYGVELGGDWGKIALSLFRVIAVVYISRYLIKMIRLKFPKGSIVSVSLILAGAVGNIIDSLFYGVIFNSSHGQVATFMPEGGGYSSFLHGKVVDMLHFPMIETYLPSWLPFWGGDYFMFFSPVFNFADSAVSVGVVILLLFYRSVFDEKNWKKNE